MAQVQQAPVAAAAPKSEGATLVLDLGSRSRKQVKRLRKGRGALMGRVQHTVEQLREDKELSASADVLIVIVKQKPKSRGWLF